MFTKKQFIVLMLLVVILSAGVFLFRSKFNQWSRQGGVEVPASGEVASFSPASGSDALLPDDELRAAIMEDVAGKIGEFSPIEPVLGGKWYILRYWFVDGSQNIFYVEYEDGHIIRKLLLTANLLQAPSAIDYKINAYFEPGESDWALKSGEDQNSALPLILYEYDEAAKAWMRKN